LIFLADASNSFLDALPSIPPTAENPYTGATSTASTRALVQSSLNKWATGHVKVPEFNTGSDGVEQDTRSFGETHASELSVINASENSSSIPATGALSSNLSQSAAHPIDVNQLNQTPVQVPGQISQDKILTASPPSSSISLPTSQTSATPPTVAETGIPLAAGTAGPGPSKGTLSPQSPQSIAPPYGSPEAIASATPGYLSAEEEKKSLERAERERVLQLGGSGTAKGGEPSDDPNDSAPPPAYND
jgi:hypothetical protein